MREKYEKREKWLMMEEEGDRTQKSFKRSLQLDCKRHKTHNYTYTLAKLCIAN